MTKKSAARVLRDTKKKEVEEYFKNNAVFDDLLEIHTKVSGEIAQFGLISKLVNDKELIERLEDKADVNEKILLLSKDLEKVIKDLNKTYEGHKDRTGRASDPDEYMWALTVYQNYLQIASIVQGTIIPTAATIYEQFSVAERKLIAEKKAAEAEKTETKEEVV